MRTPGTRERLRQRLTTAAHREITDLVKALPPQVKKFADELPVHFEMMPRPFELDQGIAPDTLGLFSGDAYADQSSSMTVEPSQITLYLENIWDFAQGDSAEFREEVKKTYLHELGHYLGLDEDDLMLRDLD